MALESGTWIDDLVVTNPPGGDDKRQGDDHLRLIKTVLRNSIKRVSRAFYVPSTVVKSANYTVLASDDNMTFLCDTTVAFTLTLPVLATTDKGWCCYVVKTSGADLNPVFIAPPSGFINGLWSKVRRSTIDAITKVLWTGTAFTVTRPNGPPPGVVLDFHASNLPAGYLWANGAAFSATDYVELAGYLGGAVTPDHRGRVAAGVDNMGGAGAAGRLGNVITPTLGTAGGTEQIILTIALIPSHAHNFTTGVESQSHTHSGTTATESQSHTHSGTTADVSQSHTHTFSGTTTGQSQTHTHSYERPETAVTASTQITGTSASVWTAVRTGATTGNASVDHTHDYSGTTANANQGHTHSFTTGNASQTHTHTITTGNASQQHVHSGTTDVTGSDGAHSNMQPTIICNKIVVAE